MLLCFWRGSSFFWWYNDKFCVGSRIYVWRFWCDLLMMWVIFVLFSILLILLRSLYLLFLLINLFIMLVVEGCWCFNCVYCLMSLLFSIWRLMVFFVRVILISRLVIVNLVYYKFSLGGLLLLLSWLGLRFSMYVFLLIFYGMMFWYNVFDWSLNVVWMFIVR